MIFGLDIEIFVVFGLLAILLYVALSKTLFNTQRKGRKGVRYSIITTLVATPILFYIALVSVLFFKLFAPEFQKDFDKKAWTDLKELRYEMKDDLVDSKILESKTKNEVIILLGEPDRKDSTGIWTYDLGVSKAGFGWQFNDLQLHFKNEQVEKSELIEIID